MDASLKISKGLQNLIISAKGLFSISLTNIKLENGVKMTPRSIFYLFLYISKYVNKITSRFKSVQTDYYKYKLP